jgi:predicted RNA methylase
VQLDIRQGHAQTVDKVLNWLQEEGGVKGTTICDAGCGTGVWRVVVVWSPQRLLSKQKQNQRPKKQTAQTGWRV